MALTRNTTFVIVAAVNWFAGLRCRWQIQQAENRKKHERCDRPKGSNATMFLTVGVIINDILHIDI